MLILPTDQSSLSVMLVVIHVQPIDGWTSVQWKLQVDKYTLSQHRENTVYSVQQATASLLQTAVSYHAVCLHDIFSTVGLSASFSVQMTHLQFTYVVHDTQPAFCNHVLVEVLITDL